MTKFVNAVLEYFQHNSTWQGLLDLLKGAGIFTVIPDPVTGGVILSGFVVSSFIKIFVQDRNVDKSATVQ